MNFFKTILQCAEIVLLFRLAIFVAILLIAAVEGLRFCGLG
jgi:hypothetical protein